MRVVLVLVVVALLLPVETLAYYFTDYSVGVVLDDRVRQTVRAKFVPEETTTRLSIELTEKPLEVRAFLDGEPVPATTQSVDDAYGILIESSTVIERNTPHDLVLTFSTKPQSERTSRGILYSHAFTPSVQMQRYSLTVSLPPGATIAFENNAPLISPTASLSTDGKRIKLTWKDSLEAGESFTALVVYREETESFSVTFVILLFLLLVIGTVAYSQKRLFRGLVSKYRHGEPRKSVKKAEQPEKTEGVPVEKMREMLTPDENRILDVVLHFGGKALQSDVVRDTGFSKSKVSKVLRGLEVKAVLVKQPYGKTNILRLAEKYKS